MAAKAKFKEIGGSFYKWWNMWFNLIIRGTSYQRRFLILNYFLYKYFENLKYWHCMAVVSLYCEIMNTTLFIKLKIYNILYNMYY